MTKRRPGYTLIEMIAVMAIMAVVFSALGVSFHIASLSVRGIQTTSQRDAQLHRLALQLRSDLHTALSADIEKGAGAAERAASILHIHLPDEQAVDYRSTERGLARELRNGDEVKQHEEYRIPGLEAAQWSIDRERSKPLVALTISRRRSESVQDAPIDEVRILAALQLLPSLKTPELP
jgi:prepilin-type N-terminal cleavage/methylation domain-containing protein